MTYAFYDSEIATFSEESLTPVQSDDLNYSKYWVNPCIDGEVIRGKKLRAQKLKSHHVAREYDVFDIDFDKPSCSTNRFQRNRALGYDHISYPTHLATHHKKKKRRKSPIRATNRSKRQPGKRKCLMRIAELAVPTKRHCIETWRNKGYTLPSFMVERLRQIIMDEKPIVKINEAINFFKARKASIKPSSQKKKYETVNTKNSDQIRTFCAIFGFKIIRKLLSPLNITLKAHLETLSKIVFDEITLILSNARRSTHKKNSSIQTGIANKVTLWIANILDDAAYKLLIEDYQELEQEERFVWEIIDDLVDNVTIISEPEDLRRLSESTCISESQTVNLPIEIIDTENYEHDVDNNMKSEQSCIVNAVLMSILENIVEDKYKSTDLPKLIETNEISDISNSISDKKTSKIVSDGHSHHTEMNLEVEDANLIDLQEKENSPNDIHSKLSIDIAKTNVGKETPTDSNDSHLGKDTYKLYTPPFEETYNIDKLANKNKHIQDFDTAIDTDIGNAAKGLTNINANKNDEEINEKHPSIIMSQTNLLTDEVIYNSSEDFNHAVRIAKSKDSKALKGADKKKLFAESLTHDTFAKVEDMNPGHIEQKKNEEAESMKLPEKSILLDEMIKNISSEDIIHTASIDDTWHSNHFEFQVADEQDQFAVSADDTLAKAEEMNTGTIAATNTKETRSITLPDKSFLPDETVKKNSSEDINHTARDTWDDNHYEFQVANDKNQFSESSTTVDKADDENIVNNLHNTNSQMEAIVPTPDDSIKKVKFSHFNKIGVDVGNEEVNKSKNPLSNDMSNYEHIKNEINKISKNASAISNNRFAPPNAYLLNRADEPWPGNLPVQAVKVTVSVSKSVLSLGKITETEEKYNTPPEEKDDLSYETDKNSVRYILEQQLQNINDLLYENESKETEHFGTIFGSNDSMETTWEIEHNDKVKNNNVHIPDINEEKQVVTKKESSRDIMDSKVINSLTVITENPSERNIISQRKLEDIFLAKMTIVHLPLININPKIFEKNSNNDEKIVQTDKKDLKTLQQKCGPIVEVSIDCGYSAFKRTHKATVVEYRINEMEIFKWCQGLENVINNLVLWSSWVENTCAYIMFLEHNEYQGRKLRRSTQKWVKLRTDINLDSALWFKLSRGLQKGLLSYKNYYENTKLINPYEKKIVKDKLPDAACYRMNEKEKFKYVQVGNKVVYSTTCGAYYAK